MTFLDIFKNIDFSTNELTAGGIAFTLLIALMLGLFIFFVYKYTYQGVMYSKTFNVSLIGLSMITASIIMAITSNIILSLGMVGALSIVRFRTAIKDPIDVVYMFWAIAAGIIVGANLIMLAIIFSLVVGIVLFVFSKVTLISEPYLLVVEYVSDNAEGEIMRIIKTRCRNFKLKSKIKGANGFELTMELRSAKDLSRLVNSIDKLSSVKKTALLSYDGNFAV